VRTLPATSCIVAFDAVVRLGLISLAARELFLTPSALSHRITALEETIGVRLFRRSSRGLSLTTAGQRYHHALGDVIERIHLASVRAGDRNGDQVVSILAPESLLSLLLIPRLTEFSELYPGIRLELYSSSTSPSSRNRQSPTWFPDLEIRHGLGESRALIFEPLPMGPYVVYGSRSLLTGKILKVAADLLSMRLIHTSAACLSWDAWFAVHQTPFDPLSYALTTQSDLLSLQAASCGLGLVLESSDLAEPFVRNGLLTKVFDDLELSVNSCRYLVYPRSQNERAGTSRCKEWLLSVLGRDLRA